MIVIWNASLAELLFHTAEPVELWIALLLLLHLLILFEASNLYGEIRLCECHACQAHSGV